MTRGPIPGQARGIYRNNLKKTPAEDGPNYQEALDLIRGFVRDYWVSNGFSPAVEEIARECGYHPSSIYYWVHRMREKGDLLFEDKVARSFRLPGQTVNFPE
jgi:hypothetical protein